MDENCDICLGSGEVECEECGGSGADLDNVECSECEGSGEVPCYECGL